MSDDITTPALAAPTPPPAPAKGNHTATIALAISVFALGFSVFSVASRFMEGEKLPALPIVQPVADVSALEERLQKSEQRQGQFAEDIAKITAHFSEAVQAGNTATPAAPSEEIKGSVEDLKQKLSGVEKDSAALQGEIRATLLWKTKLLSDWAMLQSIRQKLRDGAGFANERSALKNGEAPQDLQKLDAAANPQNLSDHALRDDLRVISPQFNSLEKMQQAGGFFQKLAVRAESLVTIRPKDGLPVNDNASGKLLLALHGAVNAHAWPAAMAASDELAKKAPPEFASWAQRLKQRSEAEAALDKMETALLASLRDDPQQPAQPAAPAAPVAEEATP